MASTRRNTATAPKTYVEGNTVRKEPISLAQPASQTGVTSEMVRANRERSTQMNYRYVVFLAAVGVICVLVCVFYLRLQSRYTALQKEETSLQTQLSSLKLENDSAYTRIMSSVNLEEVKERAMEELGMTYVSADQIVTYEAPGSDYVKQYSDVPE